MALMSCMGVANMCKGSSKFCNYANLILKNLFFFRLNKTRNIIKQTIEENLMQ
jgi:hypothetical protein